MVTKAQKMRKVDNWNWNWKKLNLNKFLIMSHNILFIDIRHWTLINKNFTALKKFYAKHQTFAMQSNNEWKKILFWVFLLK